MYNETDRDDENWEDVYEASSTANGSIRRASSPSQSIRSRHQHGSKRIKSHPKTSSQSRRRPAPPPPPITAPTRPTVDFGNQLASLIHNEELANASRSLVIFLYNYMVTVVTWVLKMMRYPIALVVFVYVLTWVASIMSNTLLAAFRPACMLPFVSTLSICTKVSTGRPISTKAQWADYPKLVDLQSETFEKLLESSVGGSSLSLNIKMAEMASSDLATLVRLSDMKSRDSLSASLGTFIQDARKTGRGLTKLSSKFGGTVDQVLAINDYALHTIEAAASGSIASRLGSLIPFRSGKADDVLVRTFTDAMDVLSSSLERLILEAEVQQANLDKLEVDLSTIHEIVTREDAAISSARTDLLADLWTKLGGNRKELKGFDNHLILLKNLGSYRQTALIHVVTALQTLRLLSDEMEDLRERVATPNLAGSKIPLEYQMKSIKMGMERLKKSRISAIEKEERAMDTILRE